MQFRRTVRLALVLAVLFASAGIAGRAYAAGVTGTVRLDPATTHVDNGATFNINVISNTTVPISGVSASITFNKSVLQIATIQRAPAWASAPLFIAGDASAIAKANQKGVLQAVAASFFPPSNVPAGDQQFVTVTFKAIACGTVNMTVPTGRVDAAMLDGRANTYGNAIPIKTTGATVTVCQGGGGASGSPAASGSASLGDSSSPGPSGSFDQNASAAPSDSSSPAPSSSDNGQSALGVSAALSDNSGGSAGGTGGTGSDQNSWLTFAMAALAVSAAGLALLILVLTIVAISAAVIGAIVAFRVWRRYSRNEASAAAPSEQPATAAASSEADAPAGASPTGAGDAVPTDMNPTGASAPAAG